MKCVLPTMPIVCSYTHYLGEKELSNFHVFNNWYWFYFHKTFFVLDLDTVHLHECTWRTIRILLAHVLLVFLTLFFFNFLNFMLTVNNCLYCISCVVCYKVEELRSKCDAKLQHVFLTFSSVL